MIESLLTDRQRRLRDEVRAFVGGGPGTATTPGTRAVGAHQPGAVLRLGVAVLLLAPACGRAPEPSSSSRLVIGQITSAVSLDPHREDEESTSSTLSHFYDTLVAFGPEMEILPGLAERWDNPTDTLWQFRLRRGVVFHDGRRFEAEDVASSLRRAIEMPDSRIRHYLEGVDRVRPVDPETVEIATRHPLPTLLNQLAFVAIVPRGTSWDPIVHPVGTGPYRFVRGTAGGAIQGERFAPFWGRPPAFERLTVRSIPQDRERAAAVARGEADIVSRFPEKYWGEGQRQAGVRMLSREGLSVIFLGFSCGRGSPLADHRLRQAVALALDRTRIASAAAAGTRGLVLPMHEIVPRGVFGSVRGPSSEPAPSAAAALLRVAGFPGGLETSLLAPDSLGSVGRAVVEQLEGVGIRVRPVIVPFASFHDRWSAAGSPLVLFAWAAGTGEASDVLDPLLHSPRGGYGGWNRFGYSNPGLDRLIEQCHAMLKPQRRREFLASALEIVRLDVPILPLVRYSNLYAVRSGLDWSPRLDRRVRAVDVRPGAHGRE